MKVLHITKSCNPHLEIRNRTLSAPQETLTWFSSSPSASMLPEHAFSNLLPYSLKVALKDLLHGECSINVGHWFLKKIQGTLKQVSGSFCLIPKLYYVMPLTQAVSGHNQVASVILNMAFRLHSTLGL